MDIKAISDKNINIGRDKYTRAKQKINSLYCVFSTSATTRRNSEVIVIPNETN